MLKKKGQDPYLVNIKSSSIFNISQEAEETTKAFYDSY